MVNKALSWIVSKAAAAWGFIDPMKLFKQLESFSQPSEVAFPIELVRFGAAVHARGAINYCAIQHNLDWLWPYWAQQQFYPHTVSFVPRAFTVTHINLTHRNWTALGVPGNDHYPIVDPRGLIMPFYDSWSLDCWLISQDPSAQTENLVPALRDEIDQQLIFRPVLKVRTISSGKNAKLTADAWTEKEGGPGKFSLRARFEASAKNKSWLIVALRPCNPEGISVINDIELLPGGKGWRVNKNKPVYFDQTCDTSVFSNYEHGDVYTRLFLPDTSKYTHCSVGMATAAALFEIQPGKTREVSLYVPLEKEEGDLNHDFSAEAPGTAELWRKSISRAPMPVLPSAQFRFLYEASLHTIVLLSPHEIFPGPFTYKHFWFRDAALMSCALICAGLPERAENVIDEFLCRQKKSGYFYSQDGEWDSNGQVLWIMQKYCQFTGRPPKPRWKKHIQDGARWITRKRISGKPKLAHNGLFPAGFSAEYLGPNDFYYWDDFWGVQGLKSAVWLLEKYGENKETEALKKEADNFLAVIEACLKKNKCNKNSAAMSASPYRRPDSGSIGSLVAGYPLRLFPEKDPRLSETINYLTARCFVRGTFFQDIAHAGMNPYLTLHMAQNMLRAGDARYFETVQSLAGMATSTGQWPEAIHPHTLGGCMGDGQHAWASVEWIMMVRNMFVREEEGLLILCSGIPDVWLEAGQNLKWGPAPTEFGDLWIDIEIRGRDINVNWKGEWREAFPKIEIRLPGFDPVHLHNDVNSFTFKKKSA